MKNELCCMKNELCCIYKLVSDRGHFGPFKVDHDCGTELLFDLEEIVDMWNRKGRIAV